MRSNSFIQKKETYLISEHLHRLLVDDVVKKPGLQTKQYRKRNFMTQKFFDLSPYAPLVDSTQKSDQNVPSKFEKRYCFR